MSYGLTLALDGSTYAGSVAILRSTTVLAAHELANVPTPGRGGRDELFFPMVVGCMEDAGVKAADLSRVVCGAGPGSFTSLRIAASIAKGIATGTGCPLFSVSSLVLIVADSAPGRYLATMPAMRGEVFAVLVEVTDEGTVTEVGGPRLIAEALVRDAAEVEDAVLAAGLPHARRVVMVLPSLIAAGKCDLDSWEPSYGRLAEAQVRWEAAHGRPLGAAG